MSKFEKLIKEFYSLSNDIRIDEIKKILSYYGYTLASKKGSHFTFRKKVKPLLQFLFMEKQESRRHILKKLGKLLKRRMKVNEKRFRLLFIVTI